MLATLDDAKVKLEKEGLHVSPNSACSLWIAATLQVGGGGIAFSENACSLIGNSACWVVVFSSEGSLTYEVPGSLLESVSLIAAVYANYRQMGGPLQDAIKRVMTDAEQYLVGRSPAQV